MLYMPQIVSRLNADTALINYIADRLSPDTIPLDDEGQPILPAVIYTTSNIEPVMSLDLGNTGRIRVTLQIDIWAESTKDGEEVADLIRTDLDNYAGGQIEEINFAGQTRLEDFDGGFHVAQTYTVRANEDNIVPSTSGLARVETRADGLYFNDVLIGTDNPSPYELPAQGGHAGQFLKTDGTHPSWTSTLSGTGAGITGLSASNLATGTVADARLSSNVALKNQDNAFTASQTVTGTVAATAVTGNGAGLTALNASNITSGTLTVERLPAEAALRNVDNSFTVNQTTGNGMANIGGDEELTKGVLKLYDPGRGDYMRITAGDDFGFDSGITTSGTVSAGQLATAALEVVSTQTTIPTVEIRTVAGQSANLQNWANPSGVAQSWISAAFVFNGSGAGLTALPAGQLTGSIADARLSSNVPLKNAANVFTAGPQTMQTGAAGNIGAIVKGAASQSANLLELQASTGAVVAGFGLTNTSDLIFSDTAGTAQIRFYASGSQMDFGGSVRVNRSSSNRLKILSDAYQLVWATEDVGLVRDAAGVVRVSDGSTGVGSVKLLNLTSTGGTVSAIKSGGTAVVDQLDIYGTDGGGVIRCPSTTGVNRVYIGADDGVVLAGGTQTPETISGGSILANSAGLRANNGSDMKLGSGISTSNDNWNNFHQRTTSHITWGTDTGIARDSAGVVRLSNASTGVSGLKCGNVSIAGAGTGVASLQFNQPSSSASAGDGALLFQGSKGGDGTTTMAATNIAGTSTSFISVSSSGVANISATTIGIGPAQVSSSAFKPVASAMVLGDSVGASTSNWGGLYLKSGSVLSVGSVSVLDSSTHLTVVARTITPGEQTGYDPGTALADGVYNDTTFTGNTGSTGYTISDIVKCLKQAGLLAM